MDNHINDKGSKITIHTVLLLNCKVFPIDSPMQALVKLTQNSLSVCIISLPLRYHLAFRIKLYYFIYVIQRRLNGTVCEMLSPRISHNVPLNPT
jgi:hypothetical protein